MVLGLIYASVVYRSRKRQLMFVLVASIAVPIAANGVRAYGIILLAYLTNNRLAVGVDHIVYGWLFFIVIQLALFAIGLYWRESPRHEDKSILVHPAIVAVLPTEPVPSTKAALIAAIAAVALVGLHRLLVHICGTEQQPSPLAGQSQLWMSACLGSQQRRTMPAGLQICRVPKRNLTKAIKLGNAGSTCTWLSIQTVAEWSWWTDTTYWLTPACGRAKSMASRAPSSTVRLLGSTEACSSRAWPHAWCGPGTGSVGSTLQILGVLSFFKQRRDC